jgi:anti-anti-sigma regulatory factor
LPVLASLFDRSDRGGDQASLETMEVDLDTLLAGTGLDDAPRAVDSKTSEHLVLIDKETGRMIPLLPQGVTIGREAGCHLELADAGVSRVHAKCWFAGSEAYVQDLESRNGTYLRGRRIDADPVRISEGDSIRFGTVEVSVVRLEGRQFQVAVESAVAGWLTEREFEIDTESELPIDSGRDDDGDLPPAERVVFEELPEFLLCERMGDVLVITPRWDGLVDAGLCDAVREALSRAEAAGLPRRVVVSLSFVGQFSGQLVGVLLSQHLRLRPFGGEVRICEPQPLVTAYLSEIGVDQLLTLYPTLQDAVLDAWTE